MSYAEYIESAQIGEFFWFLAALTILVLSLIKIFVLKEKFTFDENRSMTGSISRMGTKGIEYQLTVNNEPLEERASVKDAGQVQKTEPVKQTEQIQSVEREGAILNINQISPNRNSRYYSPNGKELKDDLDFENVEKKNTPSREIKLNKLSSPVIKENRNESNSYIDFESYVEKAKSPEKSTPRKIEESSEKKLKDVNESQELSIRKNDNTSEIRNRNSPNPKAVVLQVNTTPSKGGFKSQMFEVKSVQGASTGEIKEEIQKSDSLKEISLGNQMMASGDSKPPKRDEKEQNRKNYIRGAEEMIFKCFPLMNLFILNITTHASYPFSAFLIIFYILWVGIFEVGKVLHLTKYKDFQDYVELGSKGLILILFINYFSTDHSKL